MIYSSAPLRITFCGGGSDYKSFYSHNTGAVFGAAIDKRVHVFINDLSQFADEKIRFTYRQTESVQRPEEITHPIVRESLKFFGILEGINIATMADLPGKTGLGSSSAFTVALIGALAKFCHMNLSSSEIVNTAYQIEREIVGEAGGIQDHLHATYGGFRLYEMFQDDIRISPSLLQDLKPDFARNHLLLIKSGNLRDSKVFANATEKSINSTQDSLAIKKSAQLASEAFNSFPIFADDIRVVESLSETLNSGWALKKQFQKSDNETLEAEIAKLWDIGIGGVKICGAGESGFLLVVGSSQQIASIVQSYPSESLMTFNFVEKGLDVLEL